MEDRYIAELVKWRAKPDVSDSAMVKAVDGLLADLQELPGFVRQFLYKDKDGQWVDLYFWETEKQAVASNDLMADKASFGKLISLIEPETVTIEMLNPVPV